MRYKIGLLAVMVVVFGFSSKKEPQSISGKWTLICYENSVSSYKDCRPSYEYFNGSLSFTFEDEGANGTIKGHTVSNEVFGDYKLFQDNKITITSFGGSRVLEHGWGNDFWTKFSKSNSYQFKSDTLMIYYGDETKAMIFIPFID